MMNKKDFYEYVKDNVKEYLPEKYLKADIRLLDVIKKNGLSLTAMAISAEESNHTLRIYLDSFYQEYCHGKDVDTCVGEVADIWIERIDMKQKVDVNALMEYSNIKDKLQLQICDAERNQEWLKDKVTIMQGDFAAYFTVNLEENEEGITSFAVNKAHLDTWKIDVQTLQHDTEKADKNRKPVLYSMENLMGMLAKGEAAQNLLNRDRKAEEFIQPMFCLTNEARINAASLIIYEDIRKQIGEFMNGDFYILPSSIHEILILPADGAFSVQELNNLVQEVNENVVALEDLLSNKVQFCDGRTAILENAEKREYRIEKERNAASKQSVEKVGIHGALKKAKEEIKERDVMEKPKSNMRDTAIVI